MTPNSKIKENLHRHKKRAWLIFTASVVLFGTLFLLSDNVTLHKDLLFAAIAFSVAYGAIGKIIFNRCPDCTAALYYFPQSILSFSSKSTANVHFCPQCGLSLENRSSSENEDIPVQVETTIVQRANL